ncbi:TIGR03088 family PEP-CTERM/XrtA system glycosyltransferase [Massilia sp. GCM10023247]|uniref:TIGR03088 family PEP-CTERM/XrtA system glycosyltransferase n=1 Tax=Massilia sp. GCM10023247 TaxID=3252643 RepID=UPI003617F760
MANSAKEKVAHGDVPLVAHLVYSFGCGGLQTLVAECINRMPVQNYRHAVICLTDAKDEAARISRTDVVFHDLDKPPGNSVTTHLKLWRLLRRLRPAVLHTYNVGTIEYQAIALLAGVPVRIHAEHGRDSIEIDGKHSKYNLLRRLLIPVIDAYVPVSADLGNWLRQTIGVPEHKIAMVINGVDTEQYVSPDGASPALPRPCWIGTVGRVDRIKNHVGLLDIFAVLLERFPAPAFDLRLAIVGDGPLLGTLRDRVASQGWGERVALPGARSDIADIMRGFSIFVLPSHSEATPVVILEAMATALPVVASRVGGIPQLVLDQQTGLLADPENTASFVDAISTYINDPQLRKEHGAAGRAHIKKSYSVDAMVAGYDALYTRHMGRKGRRR